MEINTERSTKQSDRFCLIMSIYSTNFLGAYSMIKRINPRRTSRKWIFIISYGSWNNRQSHVHKFYKICNMRGGLQHLHFYQRHKNAHLNENMAHKVSIHNGLPKTQPNEIVANVINVNIRKNNLRKDRANLK